MRKNKILAIVISGTLILGGIGYGSYKFYNKPNNIETQKTISKGIQKNTINTNNDKKVSKSIEKSSKENTNNKENINNNQGNKPSTTNNTKNSTHSTNSTVAKGNNHSNPNNTSNSNNNNKSTINKEINSSAKKSSTNKTISRPTNKKPINTVKKPSNTVKKPSNSSKPKTTTTEGYVIDTHLIGSPYKQYQLTRSQYNSLKSQCGTFSNAAFVNYISGNYGLSHNSQLDNAARMAYNGNMSSVSSCIPEGASRVRGVEFQVPYHPNMDINKNIARNLPRRIKRVLPGKQYGVYCNLKFQNGIFRVTGFLLVVD